MLSTQTGSYPNYQLALIKAEKETGLKEATFPQECPYDFQKIIDDAEDKKKEDEKEIQ
jgi:hypothetical protein